MKMHETRCAYQVPWCIRAGALHCGRHGQRCGWQRPSGSCVVHAGCSGLMLTAICVITQLTVHGGMVGHTHTPYHTAYAWLLTHCCAHIHACMEPRKGFGFPCHAQRNACRQCSWLENNAWTMFSMGATWSKHACIHAHVHVMCAEPRGAQAVRDAWQTHGSPGQERRCYLTGIHRSG